MFFGAWHNKALLGDMFCESKTLELVSDTSGASMARFVEMAALKLRPAVPLIWALWCGVHSAGEAGMYLVV